MGGIQDAVQSALGPAEDPPRRLRRDQGARCTEERAHEIARPGWRDAESKVAVDRAETTVGDYERGDDEGVEEDEDGLDYTGQGEAAVGGIGGGGPRDR